jgi:hypothetical protein
MMRWVCGDATQQSLDAVLSRTDEAVKLAACDELQLYGALESKVITERAFVEETMRYGPHFLPASFFFSITLLPNAYLLLLVHRQYREQLECMLQNKEDPNKVLASPLRSVACGLFLIDHVRCGVCCVQLLLEEQQRRDQFLYMSTLWKPMHER